MPPPRSRELCIPSTHPRPAGRPAGLAAEVRSHRSQLTQICVTSLAVRCFLHSWIIEIYIIGLLCTRQTCRMQSIVIVLRVLKLSTETHISMGYDILIFCISGHSLQYSIYIRCIVLREDYTQAISSETSIHYPLICLLNISV